VNVYSRNDKKPLTHVVTLAVYLQVFYVISLGYPTQMFQCPILHILATEYPGSPHLSPLWCWKITWWYRYMSVISLIEVFACLNALFPGMWIRLLRHLVCPSGSIYFTLLILQYGDLGRICVEGGTYKRNIFYVPPVPLTVPELQKFFTEGPNKTRWSEKRL